MPMMPMLPAKLVRNVRPFLVIRLFSESESAVRSDIERFFGLVFSLAMVDSSAAGSAGVSSTGASAGFSGAGSSAGSYGSVSPTIPPSSRRMIRVE